MKQEYISPTMKHTPTNLGAMLRRYRVNESLGLRELAQRIGIGAPTLMRVEQGYEMAGETLMKLLNWMMQTDGKGNGDEVPEVRS